MPKKKPDSRDALSPLDTPLGRIELLLEDMRSQNGATLEAVLAARRETNERFSELDGRLSGRIDILALAVRANSEASRRVEQKLGEDIRKNGEDIRKNGEAIQRVELKLDRKVDAESVRDLSARVVRLERARAR